MSNYRVPRFAPTTLQAPRLQSYGDALAPVANWADKMQQLEEKRKDIESQRNFLRERDAVKMQHDFDVAAQNNDYALKRMDIQNKFVAGQNDLDRTQRANFHEDQIKNWEKDYSLRKTKADRTYGLQLRQLSLAEQSASDARKARNEAKKKAAAVGSLIGQYLKPTADPMKEDVVRTEKVWDPTKSIQIKEATTKYGSKLKGLNSKVSGFDSSAKSIFNDFKNNHNIPASVKAKIKTPEDLAKLDVSSIRGKLGAVNAKGYVSKINDIYSQKSNISSQIDSVKKEYYSELDKFKTDKPIYGKVFDPDKKLVDIDNKISGLNQALAMTNDRTTQTQLLSAINILKNEYSDVYKKYKEPIVKKQAKLLEEETKTNSKTADKVTNAQIDMAKMKYQAALKTGDKNAIAAAEKEYQDLVNNLSYGKK